MYLQLLLLIADKVKQRIGHGARQRPAVHAHSDTAGRLHRILGELNNAPA
jgi:hypothetical protein